MTEDLSNHNHHVLPGDVLLLSNAGLLALGNRLGQRALRLTNLRRKAKFTHVALVISQTHIADAIPKEGVRMRSWRDAAGNYDLDKCIVVRHPALSCLVHDPERLLGRIQYYYAQRYTLTSLARRTVKHNKGVVCSQFVALVLRDLGLPPVATNAMRALPSDIDHNTRGKNGWRQFPFSQYGWCSVVSSATTNDAAITARNPTEASIRLSEATSQLAASSMSTTETICRVFAELDRQLLTIAEALNNAQDRIKSDGLSGAGPELLEGLSDYKFSGASLLEQWHSLYIDDLGVAPKVLADADVPERLARHCVLLSSNIEKLTHLVTTANDQTEIFQNHWGQIAALSQQGCEVPLELLSLMRQRGSMLLNSMDWLEDESTDAILARCEGYAPLVNDTLMPLLPKLGVEGGQQALDQLNALLMLDEQCLNWISGSKRILLLLTNSLASMLPN